MPFVKRKAKAVISARNAAGALEAIVDRRFEAGEWPISFDVPADDADLWLEYLRSECRRRGWGQSSIGQIGRRENSDSITITTSDRRQLSVAADRRRQGKALQPGTLRIRARSFSEPVFSTEEAEQFFSRVSERCAARDGEDLYCLGILYFDGRPWRGELWLDDAVRLASPSKPYDEMFSGPQTVLVNMMVRAVDGHHASSIFSMKLRELSVFMTISMGRWVSTKPCAERAWTVSVDSEGKSSTKVLELGYRETNWPSLMPRRGELESVPFRDPGDPKLRFHSIDERSEEFRSDIVELWEAFKTLDQTMRRRLLGAGSLLQAAAAVVPSHETTAFALVTAAIEALKPTGPQFVNCNMYDVLEALFGPGIIKDIKQWEFEPLRIRNANLHSGEVFGSEFEASSMSSGFRDPLFGATRLDLWHLSQVVFIEWLRRGGLASVPFKASEDGRSGQTMLGRIRLLIRGWRSTRRWSGR